MTRTPSAVNPAPQPAKRMLRAHGFNLKKVQFAQVRNDQTRGGLSYPLRPLTCQSPVRPGSTSAGT